MKCESERIKTCRYDELGKEGLDDGPDIDPAQLFGMIFGSDVFEDYVGELQMATAVSSGMEEHQVSVFLQNSSFT